MRLSRRSFSGSNVQYELVFLPEQVFRLGGRTSNATHELMFIASEVAPLGLVNYHVERINEVEAPPRPARHNSTEDVVVENGVRSIRSEQTKIAYFLSWHSSVWTRIEYSVFTLPRRLGGRVSRGNRKTWNLISGSVELRHFLQWFLSYFTLSDVYFERLGYNVYGYSYVQKIHDFMGVYMCKQKNKRCGYAYTYVVFITYFLNVSFKIALKKSKEDFWILRFNHAYGSIRNSETFYSYSFCLITKNFITLT